MRNIPPLLAALLLACATAPGETPPPSTRLVFTYPDGRADTVTSDSASYAGPILITAQPAAPALRPAGDPTREYLLRLQGIIPDPGGALAPVLTVEATLTSPDLDQVPLYRPGRLGEPPGLGSSTTLSAHSRTAALFADSGAVVLRRLTNDRIAVDIIARMTGDSGVVRLRGEIVASPDAYW